MPGLFLLGEGAESLAHSRAVGGWVVAVLVLITGAFTFGLRGADRQGTANFMGDIHMERVVFGPRAEGLSGDSLLVLSRQSVAL